MLTGPREPRNKFKSANKLKLSILVGVPNVADAGPERMITTTCLDSTTRKFTNDFPAADISDYCLSEQNVVWADVSDPTGKDFDELAEE